MILKHNPYHLFLFAGLILVLAYFIDNQGNTIDIHFHDTYYVVGISIYFWFLAIFFWLLWFLYWLLRNRLYSKSLTNIHVAVSLVSVGASVLLLFFGPAVFSEHSRQFASLNNLSSAPLSLQLFIYSLLIIVLIQLLFFLNVVAGIFVKR